jgi:hypothetical protein
LYGPISLSLSHSWFLSSLFLFFLSYNPFSIISGKLIHIPTEEFTKLKMCKNP